MSEPRDREDVAGGPTGGGMADRRSLKFCMVTTFYPPYSFGGDGLFVYRLANELARRDHRVEVVHCVDAYELLSSGAAPREQDYPHHPNVTVHRLRSRVGALSPLITQQTGHPGPKAGRLRQILDRGAFDVIHFHNVSLIGPRALSYGGGVKLYTLHEHWLVCPMHVLWKFDREPCSRKQCLACTLHGRRPPQLWRYTNLLDRMLEHLDAIIAPSRFTLEKHRAMGLTTRVPIVQLPHFLPDPGPPESGHVPSSADVRPFYLFAGRLERLKGVQVLIEAFRRFRGCDLLIAGAGGIESELRRQAGGLPHVTFLGRLPYADLQALLRRALAVVVPSVGYEVFPMALLEALAHGTPAVVHKLGPLPEIVEQSGGGLVYDDVGGLARALDELRSDPELRAVLGERARRAYLRYWTPEAHLGQYFDLIHRSAASRSAPQRRGSVGSDLTTAGGLA